jgi:hypothetical protein
MGGTIQETGDGGGPSAWTARAQVTMLAFVDVEARIPADHPLRTIKAVADQALAKLSKVISNSYQLWVLEWIMPTMRAAAKPSTLRVGLANSWLGR